MIATITPASTVKPQQIHPLSYSPKIRAVLKAGADREWEVKDIAALLNLSERAVQEMIHDGTMASTAYPTKPAQQKPRRRVSAGSLLLYMVRNSTELSEADVLGALSVILDQLPSTILSQLVTHLQRHLQRRASQPVLVIAEESARRPVQFDLFATPNTTPNSTPPRP
jgi:hypothetical protein